MQRIITDKPITPAQIDAWKKEFKNVYSISVKDDNYTPPVFPSMKDEELLKSFEKAFPKQDIEKSERDFMIAELTHHDAHNWPVITGYFRRPTIDELGVSSQAKDKNALTAATILYNTCLIGGHPAFENDDEVKLSAMAQFKDIIKTREATIKKL